MMETTTNGNPKYPTATGVWRILNVVGGTFFGVLLAMAVIGVTPSWAWLASACAVLVLGAWYATRPGKWIW